MATTKTTTVDNSFFGILTRTNKAIQADRAIRISEDVRDEQNTLIMSIKKKKREAQNRIDTLLDMSTSNNVNHVNRVDNFDSKAFTSELHKLKLTIMEADVELQVAEETFKALFPED